MMPYTKVAMEYGSGSWLLTSSMIPRVSSYFLPPHSSLLWNWLSSLEKNLSMAGEQHLFIGAMPLIALFAVPLVYRYSDNNDELMGKGMIVFFALIFFFYRHAFHRWLFFVSSYFKSDSGTIRHPKRCTKNISIFIFVFFLIGIIITKLWSSQRIDYRS
jgi:hypothetical protein